MEPSRSAIAAFLDLSRVLGEVHCSEAMELAFKNRSDAEADWRWFARVQAEWTGVTPAAGQAVTTRIQLDRKNTQFGADNPDEGSSPGADRSSSQSKKSAATAELLGGFDVQQWVTERRALLAETASLGASSGSFLLENLFRKGEVPAQEPASATEKRVPISVRSVTLGRTVKSGTRRFITRLELVGYLKEKRQELQLVKRVGSKDPPADLSEKESRARQAESKIEVAEKLVGAILRQLLAVEPPRDVSVGAVSADEDGQKSAAALFSTVRAYDCTEEKSCGSENDDGETSAAHETSAFFAKVVKHVGRPGGTHDGENASKKEKLPDCSLSYQVSVAYADGSKQILRFVTVGGGAYKTSGKNADTELCTDLVRVLYEIEMGPMKMSAQTKAPAKKNEEAKKLVLLSYVNQDAAPWDAPVIRELEENQLRNHREGGVHSSAANVNDYELVRLDVRYVDFDLISQIPPHYRLVVNRVSDAQRPELVKAAHNFLSYCELHGIKTVNGSVSLGFASSKALQSAALSRIGVPTPDTAVWRCGKLAALPSEEAQSNDNDKLLSVKDAARVAITRCREELVKSSSEALGRIGGKFPILLKPNSGGFGRGIVKIQTREEMMSFLDGRLKAAAKDVVRGEVERGVQLLQLQADDAKRKMTHHAASSSSSAPARKTAADDDSVAAVRLDADSLAQDMLSRFFTSAAGPDGVFLMQRFVADAKLIRVFHVDRGKQLLAAVEVVVGESLGEQPFNTCMCRAKGKGEAGSGGASASSSSGDKTNAGGARPPASGSGAGAARSGSLRLLHYEVNADVKRDIRRIAEACSQDVGSIEFLETGSGTAATKRFYIDVNFLSTLPKISQLPLGREDDEEPVTAFARYLRAL